jgi:hypothetical protein
MKLLIENFKKFLTEGWAGSGFGGTLNPGKYMNEPGAAAKAVERGEELKGWDKYAQLVAMAYRGAPDVSEAGEEAFTALMSHIDKNFRRIASRVDVKFVDGQPYDNADQMKQRVNDEGVLYISKDFNQAGFFGEERNLYFRALHDWIAHLKATADPKKITQFGFKGEMQAYNEHANFIGKNAKALPALFIEVVGQVCHVTHYGDFPDQKIATLPQFSHTKLGAVDGYSIIDGELVKA